MCERARTLCICWPAARGITCACAFLVITKTSMILVRSAKHHTSSLTKPTCFLAMNSSGVHYQENNLENILLGNTYHKLTHMYFR